MVTSRRGCSSMYSVVKCSIWRRVGDIFLFQSLQTGSSLMYIVRGSLFLT